MADEEEYGELAEINLSQYGGRWGRSPGGGSVSVINSPHHLHNSTSRFSSQPPHQPSHRAGSYEAEDILYSRGGGSSRGRSGLYYSPPGTSYTIVERPTTAPTPGKHPRGTYLGSSATFNNARANHHHHHHHHAGSNGKKPPISPEQVLRYFGSGGGGSASNKMTHHAAVGRRSAVSSPASSPQQHHHNLNMHQDLVVRTVNMMRPPETSHGFGICVKGGKDSDVDGVGVYISRVEEGSVAERAGLRPGDTILEVNGTPFSTISHEEALKMLKSCRKLSMTVKSPNLHLQPATDRPLSHQGGPWIVRQTYSWMDRQGRPVSPPLEYAQATPPVVVATPPPPPAPRYYSRASKEKVNTRKVELSIEPGQSLGLMIRGGVEYNLGIFITGVDKDSVADRAGLMIGDQILEVNGQSFLDVTHDEAVNQLKFHKRMTLTVRDVGKVPHSCTAYDDVQPWESHSPGYVQPELCGCIHLPDLCGRGARKPRSPALQMVEEKARVVLKKSEFTTLAYYQEEYSARQMTIEAFVAVLLELLNTPEKYTLLTELREVVLPEDRSRFDELVYRREAEGQRCREFRDMLDQREHERQGHAVPRLQRKGGGVLQGNDNNHALLLSNIHDIPGPPELTYQTSRPYKFPEGGVTYEQFNEPEEYRTPSEDSGVGMGPPELITRVLPTGDWQGGSPSTSSHLDKRTSDLALSNDEEFDTGHQELAHKLSRSFDMKEDQDLLETEASTMIHQQSMQRLSKGEQVDFHVDEESGALVVPDQQGNLRITVKKTKPILGIAIEGGANTKHPLPRIINIHENGAAFEAGGLEVGQLILEVDGQKVEGLQHQDVARLIAESFARRERHDIEFLVVEAKKSNLEPKPTALIFLEA
ncbi:whirlin isoform X3 [Zootermopsis nevadensis]|uniref:whirlin isoform X3 n=1 Tax=Zootermopsis nevadensis TaxID=136037 RepID=UPI000B8EA21B|nr:whirlin isoform X3 [Zootermopsis nevadensis]